MDEDELSAMTVAELKKRLKELSLTTSGKKADLITRLLESEDDEDVLILDDDDDEEITLSPEFEDDEILEAEPVPMIQEPSSPLDGIDLDQFAFDEPPSNTEKTPEQPPSHNDPIIRGFNGREQSK